MLRYQIRTSETVKQKIEAVGGDESVAKRILDGLRWRLAHDPDIGTVIDPKRNIRLIKSEKKTTRDPVIKVLYRMLDRDPDEYDIEIMDIEIIP
jgi:hypothetical protein